MKMLKSLFVLVLALIAVTAVTRSASALPPCGHWVGSTWVLYTEGGNNSFYCWWKNAYWSGQVTAAQFESACNIPAPVFHDDNCSLQD